jgi:hypothetical protein
MCGRHEKHRNKVLVIKCEGKNLFWRTGYRWEDNFKISLKEIGFERVDWVHVA